MPPEHQKPKYLETNKQVITAFVMHGRSVEEAEFFAKNALHIRIDFMKYLVTTNKLNEAAIPAPEEPVARKEFIAHLTTPLGATLEFLKRDSEFKPQKASTDPLPIRYRTSTYQQTTHFQITLYKALQKISKALEEKEPSKQKQLGSHKDFEQRKQKTENEIKRLHNKHVENAAARVRAGKASLPVQLGSRGEYDFSEIWLVEMIPRGGRFPGHILEIRKPYTVPEEHYLTEREIQDEISHGNVAIQDEEHTPKTGLRVKQTKQGGRMILKVDTVDKKTDGELRS